MSPTIHFTTELTLERGSNETEYDVTVQWSYDTRTDEHTVTNAWFNDHSWPVTTDEFDRLDNTLAGMVDQHIAEYGEWLRDQAMDREVLA